MTKITTAQADLLGAAAKSDGGQIETPSEAKLKAVIAALLKRGYIISLPRPDGPSWLLITEAGRQAIGAPAAKTAARPRAKPPAPRAATEVATPKGKLGLLVHRLRQPNGAGIDELVKLTGWQAHSVRGAISGAIKKKLGLVVASEKGERVYRILERAGG